MSVVFRADASTIIGSGHVMRCLTLADKLRESGTTCVFISYAQAGDLHDLIRSRGFEVRALDGAFTPGRARDAEQTRSCIEPGACEWLVVDHYAIEAEWERALRGSTARILVIDDLANRMHDCDLLLDQNLGRAVTDYDGRVPTGCAVLAGPRYALLRPEFRRRRPESLARRRAAELRHLLLSFGGADAENMTSVALRALVSAHLPSDAVLTVVLGAASVWEDDVRAIAETMPFPTEVLKNVTDMATLMIDADAAIGAAGTSAWERCCLGLPSVLAIQAENQRPGAMALHAAGAAYLAGEGDRFARDLPSAIERLRQPTVLRAMQEAAASLVDGSGAERLVEYIDVKHV